MFILNYHEISAQGNQSPYAAPKDLFQKHLYFLIKQRFSFCTLGDLLDEKAVPNQRVCALTFDDGRLGAFQYAAPFLQRYGIRATYFVCTDYADGKPVPFQEAYSGFMGWGEIEELKNQGHVIGSHSKSHPSFFEIQEETLVEEIAGSKKIIEERLSSPCHHLAAPWGQINERVIEVTKRSNYRTLSSTTWGMNKKPYGLFGLRRLNVLSSHSPQNFKNQISYLLDHG